MEKEIKIKTADRQYIYGRLTGSSRQPLFIAVHGLAGSMDEDIIVSAARWFAKQGYATFRFNLYGAEKNARQLMNITLETHTFDVDKVVQHFRKRGFEKIFIAGHSYAGPSILLSKEQDFDGVALWDPSYKVSFTKKQVGVLPAVYVKEVKGYALQWGTNFILSEEMVDEANSLKWDSLTKDFSAPLKIIVAEKGYLVKGGEQYFKMANKPKSLTILRGATHYFNDTEGMREKLFALTDAWFKKNKFWNRKD